MSRNRSLGLVALLVLLAAIMLTLGARFPAISNRTISNDSPDYSRHQEILDQAEQREFLHPQPAAVSLPIDNDSPDELRRQQILDRRELLHPVADWPTFGNGQPY